MRCFISLEIPEGALKKIKEIQEKLPEFIGKKTELDNLHLTLKFIGEIDEDKVEEVKKRLNEMKFEKFEVEIDSIGFFSEKFIRIIWLHLVNCDKLQKEIDEKLSLIFEPEQRFMSHLTIARVKKVDNKKEFLEQLKNLKIPKIKFLVEEFSLIKSELFEKGPEYTVLGNYKLI